MSTADQTIPRLDRSKPPPDFDIAAIPRQSWGTVIASGVWGPNALRAAWAHYEREHDPPGMRVRMGVGTIGFDVWAVGAVVDPVRVEWDRRLDERAPRAAAWAWYWRRIALSRALERFEFYWPACLAWADEQVAEVERWLVAGGGTLPEVLRAR